MKLSEVYGHGQPAISIEVFPPKSPDGDRLLWETLDRLQKYQPAFVSCTYGAGGSTRSRTLDICREVMDRYGLPTTAHFTCVGSSQADLCEWLAQAHATGIPNIMALRGDAPQGETGFQAAENGLRYANELVALIRSQPHPFGVGVAAYPERHPESPDAQSDLDHFVRKVDAGADAAFTQLFYVNDVYFRFRDACAVRGVHLPIVPGIMPVTEFARIKRIAAMCQATFPEELAQRLEAVQDDKEAQFEIGVEFAIEQCRELLDAGVPGIHFYALNKSQACERILDALGLSSPAVR